jgi:hypothetical protein
MRLISKRLVAIAACSSFGVSCAIPLGGRRPGASPEVAASSGRMHPADEVLVRTRGEPPVLGKLVGIDGEEVTFLPSPYWNVATRSLKLDDIVTIHLTDRKGHMGRAGGLSFAVGFVAAGALCGASAKYDEDYRSCLLGAGVLGAAAGLVGLTVGAVIDSSQPTTYRLDRMAPAKKREAVQRLVAR